ncbi:hypothetical protein AJ78_03087, partial [Emergomyces pasteurianus Ep9510]
MARRCSYCGRFGNSENIVAETGLSHNCHRGVHNSSKGEATSSMPCNSGDDPSIVAAAVMPQMATVDVNDDSSCIGTITSIHSTKEDDDEDHSGEDRNGGRNGNKKEKDTKQPNDQKLRVCGGNASSSREMETELCARCWKYPSATMLYNTPICNDCYHIAQEKR